MSDEEIAMWLGGGAQLGSTRWEQARAALDRRLAHVQADAVRDAGHGPKRWAMMPAIAAAVSAACAVAALLVAIL
jgi:hypothetical protein